jgi:hypothetical protein
LPHAKAICEAPRRFADRPALPSYRLALAFPVGMFSILPNTPWIGQSIANSGADELRAVGLIAPGQVERPVGGAAWGGGKARARLELIADADCRVEVFRCLRPLDLVRNPPTWREHDPGARAPWDEPGGTGPGDAEAIGQADLRAGAIARLAGAALGPVLDAIRDGRQVHFLIRRGDTGTRTVAVAAELVIEPPAEDPPAFPGPRAEPAP